jgi:hypothetical protein
MATIQVFAFKETWADPTGDQTMMVRECQQNAKLCRSMMHALLATMHRHSWPTVLNKQMGHHCH